MKDKPTTLKVRETGEFGRYHVESQSIPARPYLVDLTERVDEDGRAHGRCSCTWFSTNANPNFKKHGKHIPYAVVDGRVRQSATICKHISVCLNHYHRHVTQMVFGTMHDGVECDDQWQPIETAPKDGSHILLYKPEIQFTGFYAVKAEKWCINAPSLPVMIPAPTHWQPLPKPPSA